MKKIIYGIPENYSNPYRYEGFSIDGSGDISLEFKGLEIFEIGSLGSICWGHLFDQKIDELVKEEEYIQADKLWDPFNGIPIKQFYLTAMQIDSGEN